MLLGLGRCGVCRRSASPDAEELALMGWLDEQIWRRGSQPAPAKAGGSRMAAALRLAAGQVNRKAGCSG